MSAYIYIRIHSKRDWHEAQLFSTYKHDKLNRKRSSFNSKSKSIQFHCVLKWRRGELVMYGLETMWTFILSFVQLDRKLPLLPKNMFKGTKPE